MTHRKLVPWLQLCLLLTAGCDPEVGQANDANVVSPGGKADTIVADCVEKTEILVGTIDEARSVTGCDVRVEGRVDIEEGAIVSVARAATITLDEGQLRVFGGLELMGSADHPIRIVSASDTVGAITAAFGGTITASWISSEGVAFGAYQRGDVRLRDFHTTQFLYAHSGAGCAIARASAARPSAAFARAAWCGCSSLRAILRSSRGS
jgi:hypothetical protein